MCRASIAATTLAAALFASVATLQAFDDVKYPDLSGQWQGEDWGHVELKLIKPGTYDGTYTDTFGPGPGTNTLSWSAEDRRFNGTGAQGKARFGTLSVRPEGPEIRGG